MIGEATKAEGQGRIHVALREYRAGDAEAMYALDLECFEPVFRFSRRMIERYAEGVGALTLMAEVDGELVGFAIVQRDESSRMAYVMTIDVAAAWRRFGVGRRLMDEIEVRAASLEVTGVHLHVFAGNKSAILFYEHLGYRRIGVAERFYGRGMDALVYGKRV